MTSIRRRASSPSYSRYGRFRNGSRLFCWCAGGWPCGQVLCSHACPQKSLLHSGAALSGPVEEEEEEEGEEEEEEAAAPAKRARPFPDDLVAQLDRARQESEQLKVAMAEKEKALAEKEKELAEALRSIEALKQTPPAPAEKEKSKGKGSRSK